MTNPQEGRKGEKEGERGGRDESTQEHKLIQVRQITRDRRRKGGKERRRGYGRVKPGKEGKGGEEREGVAGSRREKVGL